MSRFFVATALAALAVPLLTRGSYRRLFARRWYWGSLLVAGLVLQAALGRIDAPPDHTHQVGFGLLVASYVLILGFTMRNALRTGMMVVSVGIAANFVAIAVNQGMPVDVPGDWVATGGVTTTVKHHPQASDDQLLFLSDILVIRRFDEVISFGDLILAAGLCNVTFHASRKARRRTKSRARGEAETDTTADAAGGRTGTIVEFDDLDNDDFDGRDFDNHVDDDIELDLTETPPKPPSPVVAGVIEELTELRRAARGRHPTALFPPAPQPLVGRYSGGEQGGSASGDDELESFEHATVIHISGAGIQGLQREPGA